MTPSPSLVPSVALEGRGPGHPGFLQAGPVAGLQGEGRAVHGSAVEVALGVRVAAVPHPAAAAAAAGDATPGGWREGRGRRRLWRLWRRLWRGALERLRLVHEEVVLLAELVAAVVLVAPEVLGRRQAPRAARRALGHAGQALLSLHAGAGRGRRREAAAATPARSLSGQPLPACLPGHPRQKRPARC